MENENILKELYGKRMKYEGTKIVKELLSNNEEFKNIILEGIRLCKVYTFDDELWDKIDNQNIRSCESFLDVFKAGKNLGACTPTSIQLSFSLPDGCKIAGGVVEFLKGTVNSMDGSHTWVVWNNKIYDPTFMLCIDLDFADKFKYSQENIYNPLDNPYYYAAKEFANDPDLKRTRRTV